MVSKRVVLVGVGGPTCSGKTTLSKVSNAPPPSTSRFDRIAHQLITRLRKSQWLRQIIPNSVILHQDDFAPAVEQVPIHPVHNVQDWDSKDGA